MSMCTERAVSNELRKTGGGRFDPDAEFIGFQVITAYLLSRGRLETISDAMLIPVNKLTDDEIQFVEQVARANPGLRFFLDSGVFSLVTAHMRANDMPFHTAILTPPDEMSGHATLMSRYISTVRRLEPLLWGYVEMDLGGTNQKRRARAELEAEGLRPIPVYHPLTDPPEYFDELASTYDRVCIGNLAKADRATRLRLTAMIWERRQAYPDVWLHALGLGIGDLIWAYPDAYSSVDSSTYAAPFRFGMVKERAVNIVGELVDGFIYDCDVPPDQPRGWTQAIQFSTYSDTMTVRAFLDRDTLEMR